jgi:flagellar basal-body rod modification protein FlgD
MASAVNALSSLTSSGASATQSGTTAKPPTEQMFLQLLVAQMKNQDPTNPSDPTQFVTQLAQFSQLEQVIAIRGDIEKAAGTGQSAGAAQNTNTGLTATSTQP